MTFTASITAVALIGVAATSNDALAQSSLAVLNGNSANESTKLASQIVPVGTPVRLMYLTEITSRTAILGKKFKLRVDEPVFINGIPVIPVGATAWGEIASFDSNGAVGRGGKLGVRILFLEMPGGRLPLRGDALQRGNGNGAGVAMAIIGFGLLGLFTAGDSARFKAGDTITAYVGAIEVPASPPASTTQVTIATSGLAPAPSTALAVPSQSTSATKDITEAPAPLPPK